jgi:hypothetical protein
MVVRQIRRAEFGRGGGVLTDVRMTLTHKVRRESAKPEVLHILLNEERFHELLRDFDSRHYVEVGSGLRDTLLFGHTVLFDPDLGEPGYQVVYVR